MKKLQLKKPDIKGKIPAQASRQAKGRQVAQAPKKGIKGPVLAGGPQPPALQCRG